MDFLNHLTLASTIFGLVCGLLITRKQLGFALAICAPFAVSLSILLYNEYFVPYKGGGASMWPIALIFTAAPAAVCAGLACALARLLVRWVGK